MRLTAKERVLLHLLEFAKSADAPEVPVELTQRGVRVATGIDVRHFAQYVRPLVRQGVVRERTAHVRGLLHRRKVYVLTDDGRRKATGIRERVGSTTVHVRDGLATRTATVAEILRKARGSRSLLQIVRDAIEDDAVDL